MADAPGNAEFPTTRWTLILAGRETTTARRELLAALLGDYWRPLYVYLRRRGLGAAEAEDAVQSFAVRLLETDPLARLDPSRGRLRAYLKTALQHHVQNLHAQELAQRRGGGAKVVPLDGELAERLTSAAPEGADEAFQRAWAASVFERALQALREEYARDQRRGPFALLESYFHGQAVDSYAELAQEHQMSVPQLKSFLHRARTRFRELVRGQVADTVANPDEVDQEMQELLRAL